MKLYGEARVEQEIRELEQDRWNKEQEEREQRYYDALKAREEQEQTVTWIPFRVDGPYRIAPKRQYLFTYDEIFMSAGKLGWRGNIEMLNDETVSLDRINAFAELPERYETPKEVKDAYVEANSRH